MILGHFFEKPVLRQHFFEDARENMATAHARGSARAYIFLKLTSMIVFVSKTNLEGIGEELVEIHLSTKNKEKKFKKNAKCRKFSLRFSLEFSKNKCHFLLLAAKPVFRKMA